jgi:hypothetical protein
MGNAVALECDPSTTKISSKGSGPFAPSRFGNDRPSMSQRIV